MAQVAPNIILNVGYMGHEPLVQLVLDHVVAALFLLSVKGRAPRSYLCPGEKRCPQHSGRCRLRFSAIIDPGRCCWNMSRVLERRPTPFGRPCPPPA
jgi:hypothetical protein